jgi:DNA-binding transcriptional LysR family regulator
VSIANLNLRHLEGFVAIAAAGNFTRAAQALRISQPALTVQIRQLEDAIGARLLDRNTRTVKLTRIGQQLSPVAQRLLREFEIMMQHAHELAAGTLGSVSVAALPSICSTMLPRVIASFRQDHPGIAVSLKDVVAQKVLAMVKSEEVDFGVGSFTGADPALVVVPLFQDRMKVVFPPDSVLARKRKLKLKDVAGLPLILMDPQSSVRMLVDRAFESIGHFPTPAYEATYMSSAVGMVKAGLGVAFLPSSALELSELHGLASRVVEHPSLTRDIVAVQKSGRHPSPAAASFLRALLASCKSLAHHKA